MNSNNDDNYKFDNNEIEENKKKDDYDLPFLYSTLKKLRFDYQLLIVSKSLIKLKETHKIKKMKKDIAKILTIINFINSKKKEIKKK